MITDEHRRNHLDRLVEAWDRIFDPEIVGLRHTGRKPLASTTSDCEESLHYALALLEMAERSRQGRAEAIINRFVDSPTAPDSGAPTLSLIWHRHRRRLSAALTDKIIDRLLRAARHIQSLDTHSPPTGPGCTLNAVFVMLSAADIFDDRSLRTAALSRLHILETDSDPRVRASDNVAPHHLAVARAALRAIAGYIHDSGVSAEMEKNLPHFQLQPPSDKNPAADLLAFLVGSAIRSIQCGSPDSGQHAFAALYACVMKIESPLAPLSDEATLPAR